MLWSHCPNLNFFSDGIKWLHNKSALSEVCRQTVPDTKSNHTEGSVVEDGPRATYKKHTSVCQSFLGQVSVVARPEAADVNLV